MKNVALLKTLFFLLLIASFFVEKDANAQIQVLTLDMQDTVVSEEGLKTENTTDNQKVSNSKSIKSRHKYDKKRHLLSQDYSFEKKYADFKQALLKNTGLSYTFDFSVLGQRGSPNGKGTAWQTQYYGSINWDMFTSKIGSGSLQGAYTYVQYWGKNGQYLSDNIGVVSDVNDYTSNSYYFDQLSYTHQLPGSLDVLSVTLGQFPLYNFDTSTYASNQQINFVNFALSQNATSAYPSASLGGYINFTPNSQWDFVVGVQDANNIDGSQIETSFLHRKEFTSFASVSYTPTIKNWGEGQYSLVLYNQPWTTAQPETVNGWSVNISQALNDKLTLFAKANGVTGNIEPISQSYAFGAVVNNPFDRNSLDQIGIATAVNKLNKDVNGANSRSVETVFEGYYSFGVSNFLILTPDVQFYVNPGQNDENSRTATVLSMRATLMF